MSLSSLELARRLHARHLGDDVFLLGVNSLNRAQKSDLTLALWPKDVMLAHRTNAGAILCEVGFAADHAESVPATLLVVEDIADALQAIEAMDAFPAVASPRRGAGVRVHESAWVAPDAILHDRVHVLAGAVIEACTIIEEDVVIGQNCVIGSNAFAPYGMTNSKNLACLGGVHIKRGAHVGAGVCVDRGVISMTTIGAGSLIDNLVHVGHDVVLGENVVVAAQSGLAGFALVGDQVVIAGQCGIAPHIRIGQGARISGKTFVHKDVKAFEVCSGNPGVLHAKYLSAYKRVLKE